jgi:hypothetical protein
MNRLKLLSAVALVALLLSAGRGTVFAQEPQPPAWGPIITESSGLEWITMQMEDGEKRVLVPVSSIEAVQSVRVSFRSQKEGMQILDSATVTEWRALAWYQGGWPTYDWWAEARGETSTDVTADKVYVRIEHKWRPTPDEGSWNDAGWNHNTEENATTTGRVDSGFWETVAGYEHNAKGDHQAKIDGEWFIYNDQWEPKRVIP